MPPFKKGFSETLPNKCLPLRLKDQTQNQIFYIGYNDQDFDALSGTAKEFVIFPKCF
jgi:hypothetical protein